MRLSLDDLLPNDLGNTDALDGGPVLMGHPIPSCSVYKGCGCGEGRCHCKRGWGSSVVRGMVAACPDGVFMVGPDKGHGCQQVSKAQRETSCPDTRPNRSGTCLINSVPRLPLKIALQPLSKKWGPEHRMEAGTVPGAGAVWEAGSLGRDPLFEYCAAFLSLSFRKSPIPCSQPHPSHTQPRTCLGQATELLTSFWFSTHTAGCPSPPSLSFPIHATYLSSHGLTSRPCDTVGTLGRLLSLSTQIMGGHPDNGRAPKPPSRKEKGGDKDVRAPAQSLPSIRRAS